MIQRSKIYCFTKYSEKGPSSRYRTFQYLPFWQKYYEIEVNCLLDDWYFDKDLNKGLKFLKILKSFIRRFLLLRKVTSKDLVWLEYELFPYLGTFGEKQFLKRKIPFVVDYDDAVFHAYDRNSNGIVRFLFSDKIAKIMGAASAVVTGSPYLTNYARKFHQEVIEIPTSISVVDYSPDEPVFKEKALDVFVLGWLGSWATSGNLVLIREAFAAFSAEKKSELWLMGYDDTKHDLFSGLPVKFFKWSPEKEKAFLISLDAGIMPLLENPYNHGKCGFKLIQYMAMGKPTVASPMEANLKIDREGINFFASTPEEWLQRFRDVNELINEADYSRNRKVVEEFYNSKINEKEYRTIFGKFLSKSD